MNYKIVSSVAFLTRRTIYTFSKNPFDKFNRKKQTPQQPKHTQTDNQTRSQKNKKTVSRSEKIQEQKHHTHKHSQNQKANSSHQYKKAGHLKQDLPQQNHEKQQNETNQKQQEKKSFFSQLFKTTEEVQRQQNEKKKKQAKNLSPAFKRFDKHLKEKENHRHQNQQKATKDKEMKQQKKEQPKEKQIPKITLQINNDDEDQTVILRKPKGQVRNRTSRPINPPKTEKPEQKKEVQQEQEKKQAEMHLSEQNKQFWLQFQRKIEEAKKNHKIITPRYLRLNLVNKKPEQKLQQNQEKFQEQEPFKPTNFQNLFKAMIYGGAFIYLWSNYFDVKRGKQIDPSYLKQALQQHRIDETWLSKSEMPKDNDEQIRGKQIHQYIYIRENNGDIYFCLSNQEFSKFWTESVLQYNLQTDMRTSDFYRNRTADMTAKAEAPPKKIVISETKIHKNTNVIGDLRRVLSFVLLYFFFKSLRQAGRGGGKPKTGDLKDIFKNQKSHRVKQAINVTFKDVVGMQKAKEEIVQFIDFLKNPEKYNKLGARIPRGALLTGPPGTGKTMIAKACAGESKVPFFTISGSEFIEMYVGVGAQRVRDLFKQAKQNAPSIIFIDQIDAVGKKRSGAGYGGGNDERDTTLNQLLVEMDGFDTNTNVIVFAATNQKEVLDQALTRPGRFDRLIQIDLPDLQGRKQIFQVHLKPLMLQKNIDVKDYAKRLATLTPGFSGAQIKNVCNQAAIIAARSNKDYVSILDFELATERIIGGVQKKSQLITQQTRRTVAYHECGHGVVSWFCKYANPLLKLTIIPRSKGALGFAQYLPNENQIYTKAKLMDQICVILGGRISEELFFAKISTGASDDLNKAYQIAKTIVTQYGFGDKLGWVQYQETQYAKEYSKETENKIDAEILQIMKVCTQRTRKILNEKKDILKNLAERLLQQETIDQAVIQQVLGQRPYPISKQHQDYIREKKRMVEEVKQTQAASKPKSEETIAKMKRIDYIL